MAVPRLRFTLGGLMWLIVVAALVLALVPWKLGPLAFVLGLLVGLGWVIHRVGRITRLRAAVWVCAVYPWLFLAAFYLCWGSACWVLGRPPRSGDGVAAVGRWVHFCEGTSAILMVGIPLVLVLGPSLFCWDVYESIGPTPTPEAQGLLPLALAVPPLWGSAFFLPILGDALMWWLD